MLVHEKTRRRPISHWTFSDVTFFAKLDFITVMCRLFNTKHSFLQLLSRKATLKCEVLLNQYFSQTSSHEIVRRNVKLTREILNLDSKIKHLSPDYKKRHQKAAQTTAKLVSSESKNEPNTTQPCPQISFSGYSRHGAVGQNIFPMYISIKGHSWFFKSWWCLLYFGHVQTRTVGKCWRQKTPFCLKLSSNAQKGVLSWSISISRILGETNIDKCHIASKFNHCSLYATYIHCARVYMWVWKSVQIFRNLGMVFSIAKTIDYRCKISLMLILSLWYTDQFSFLWLWQDRPTRLYITS